MTLLTKPFYEKALGKTTSPVRQGLLTSQDMEKIFKKVYNWNNYEWEKDIFEPERELITETELATIKKVCRWVRKRRYCREGFVISKKDLKELEGMK